MTQSEIRKITNNLDEYFMCDQCGSEKRFSDKKLLQDHIKHCKNVEDVNVITPAEKTRKSRSTGIKSLHFCPVCRKYYTTLSTLRYHIRRAHFNLKSKTPYHQQKKVNQIWFENVQNSDAVIEVHKTGVNSLVLRRLSKNTTIKVNNVDTNVLDLSYMYPTYNPKKMIKCDQCQSNVYPHTLLKHKLKHQSDKEMISQDLKQVCN